MPAQAGDSLQSGYMPRRYPSVPVFVLLALYAAFMVATNHRLTILDDEAIILTVANYPPATMLRTFFSGYGQHEHPPLSDLLLHEWLIVTHHSLAWTRVSAVVFYIAGLLILAQCGKLLGHARGYWAVLLFGVFWPFGYFYARIAGWYCFCFLLVALLTWLYLRLVQQPSNRRWVWFTVVGGMLLWSNYYGVAILLVLLADLLLFHRDGLRPRVLLLSCGLLILSFVPLLRALLFDAHVTVNPQATPLSVSLLKAGYVLFALLASVAVAPWFLWWSIPIAFAAVALLVLLLINQASRRFVIYFLLLIAGLLLTNHLDLKRLLFTTPWMILAIALAFSRSSPRAAAAIGSAVSLICLLGWTGITTGTHPATGNFYEPWQNVAGVTAREALRGSIIVSDSGPYFFYLNHALGLSATPAHKTFLGEDAYRSRGTTVYRDGFPAGVQPSGSIIAVEGADTVNKLQGIEDTRRQLAAACSLISSEKSTPDPAIQFKGLLGPSIPLLPYRVIVERFSCPKVSASS